MQLKNKVRCCRGKELKIDFEALGRQMLERKESLKEGGIPLDAEHAMVAGSTRARGYAGRRRAET